MKRIRIYGGQDKPKLRDKLRSLAEYCRDHLLPRKRKLDIVISLKPKLCERFGIYGECWEGENSHQFLINLDGDISNLQIIKTLAHEMVHVKQFAMGELKYLRRGDSWCGKVYSHKTPYHKQPWEKEAKELEVILYHEWKLKRYK